MFGNETSFGISFDYSRTVDNFFGPATECSGSIPFTPFGIDHATSYGPGSVRPFTYGFDVSLGGGASMVHMNTTRQ